MRYTIHNTTHIGRPKRVYCDGKLIRKVIECDTDEGWVRAFVDPIEVTDDHCAKEYIIRGKVTVEDMRRV